MYHVPLAFKCIYGCSVKEVKIRIGSRGESGDYLASCMQMIWFHVVSRRRTFGGMIC